MAAFEFARGLYPYSAEGEDLGLPFSEGVVLHYLEDRKDGWSRGAVGAQEGWFPTSYVAKVSLPVRVMCAGGEGGEECRTAYVFRWCTLSISLEHSVSCYV